MAEPLIKKGSTGQPVKDFQQGLKDLGYDPGPVDGVFGTKTENAVKQFQSDKGITADGIVGPITWLNLDEAAEFDEPVLNQGSKGLPVRRCQKRLTLAGYDVGGVDGIYGPKTAAGVKKLQHDTGLVEDGVVGPLTWAKIDALGD
jgi:peptidoglycan hydrolase-like protein with peptidoglycan-binding domain